MPAAAPVGDDLRRQVEAAVVEEVERLGDETSRVDKGALVRRFLGQGPSRATLFRWVDAAIATGRPGQALVRKLRARAAGRGHPTAAIAMAPTPEAAAAVASTTMPVPVRPEDVTGTIPVMEHLQTCIKAASDVIAHSRTKEGEVRNARLLITASEHMRRTIETAARLYEAMRSVNQVDAFHTAIIEEIAKESPEVAGRILQRVSVLSGQWTP